MSNSVIGKIDNPRADFNKSIDELQKEFLNEDFRDHYGEVYTGKVINNNDPLQLGRCRIRVFSIFDDTIPDTDLPWAIPDMSFVGSKIGSFIVPPVDALVNVYFDKGDIYCPRYNSKVVDTANPSTQSTTDYPNNMVFFETDEGDYLTMNRTDGLTTFNHRSGTKITILADGTVEINAKKLNVPTSKVGTMANTGPFCMLPACLFTGAVHTSPETTGV